MQRLLRHEFAKVRRQVQRDRLQGGDGLEVLLGHPGGPFWCNKGLAAWSIPKGLIAPDEPPLAAARREFFEETGHRPKGKSLSLRDAKQPGGKTVYAWAIEGDWNPETLKSNLSKWSGRRAPGAGSPSGSWIAPLGSPYLRRESILDRLIAATEGS